MSEQTLKHGFKEITRVNWQEPDSFTAFVNINFETGEKTDISADERTEMFLKPQLSNEVPLELQSQYEVARATFVYGYFFYPLHTLGFEQLLRVGEAAITQKCLTLLIAKSSAKFSRKLIKLKKHGILNEEEFKVWNNLKDLRNDFTHANIQRIIFPDDALKYLESITDRINNLFQNQS